MVIDRRIVIPLVTSAVIAVAGLTSSVASADEVPTVSAPKAAVVAPARKKPMIPEFLRFASSGCLVCRSYLFLGVGY